MIFQALEEDEDEDCRLIDVVGEADGSNIQNRSDEQTHKSTNSAKTSSKIGKFLSISDKGSTATLSVPGKQTKPTTKPIAKPTSKPSPAVTQAEIASVIASASITSSTTTASTAAATAAVLKSVSDISVSTSSSNSSSSSSLRKVALGDAVAMSDIDLITMLKLPPKSNPLIRTKTDFQTFFRGMQAARMLKLLDSAYADLEAIDRKNKVEKRMELIRDVLS